MRPWWHQFGTCKWRSYCLIYNGGHHEDSKTIKEINSLINIILCMLTELNKHVCFHKDFSFKSISFIYKYTNNLTFRVGLFFSWVRFFFTHKTKVILFLPSFMAIDFSMEFGVSFLFFYSEFFFSSR